MMPEIGKKSQKTVGFSISHLQVLQQPFLEVCSVPYNSKNMD